MHSQEDPHFGALVKRLKGVRRSGDAGAPQSPQSGLCPERAELDRWAHTRAAFSWVANGVPEGRVVEAVSIDPRGQIAAAHFAPSGADAFTVFAAQHDGRANVYIALNLVAASLASSTRRAKSTDVPRHEALLLDIDPVGDNVAPGRALLAAMALLPRVLALSSERKSPLLLDSGRGAQIWFRPVGAPRGAWDGIRAEFGDLLARYRCRLDPTHDAVRLARVPGSVNCKTGRIARIVPIPSKLPRHLGETLSGRRHDLDDSSRSGFEMAAADALAAFGFLREEIELLLAAYPHGRGPTEHASSRRITARKAVEARGEQAGRSSGAKEPSAPAGTQADTSIAARAQLVEDYEAYIGQFMVLPARAKFPVALWCLGTHVFKLFEVYAYLIAASPVPRCGKTRLLKVVGGLVANPLSTSNISEAALFRAVEEKRPTLLFDEADVLSVQGERALFLRNLLNAGHESDATVIRCVPPTQKLAYFNVYSPKVLAGLGTFSATVRDRSIWLAMQRKLSSDRVGRFRRRFAQKEALGLSTRAGAVMNELQAEVSRAYEKVDAHFLQSDRDADNWEPLLALTEVLCPGRVEELRECAMHLCGQKSGYEFDDSLGVQLLADLYELFADTSAIGVVTGEILERLRRREPWNELSHGKEMGSRTLAKMLRQFGVPPDKWRDEVRGSIRGYRLEPLRAAWQRYLPQIEDGSPAPEEAPPGREESSAAQAPFSSTSSSHPPQSATAFVFNRLGCNSQAPQWGPVADAKLAVTCCEERPVADCGGIEMGVGEKPLLEGHLTKWGTQRGKGPLCPHCAGAMVCRCPRCVEGRRPNDSFVHCRVCFGTGFLPPEEVVQ